MFINYKIMSSHKEKVQKQFATKIKNNYSKFADDNDNLDQLDFDEDDQY